MRSGASIMPTKTLAAVPRLAAPPILSARPSAQASARTTAGSTRQW